MKTIAYELLPMNYCLLLYSLLISCCVHVLVYILYMHVMKESIILSYMAL